MADHKAIAKGLKQLPDLAKGLEKGKLDTPQAVVATVRQSVEELMAASTNKLEVFSHFATPEKVDFKKSANFLARQDRGKITNVLRGVLGTTDARTEDNLAYIHSKASELQSIADKAIAGKLDVPAQKPAAAPQVSKALDIVLADIPDQLRTDTLQRSNAVLDTIQSLLSASNDYDAETLKQVLKKANINCSPNQLSKLPGALEEAINIVAELFSANRPADIHAAANKINDIFKAQGALPILNSLIKYLFPESLKAPAAAPRQNPPRETSDKPEEKDTRIKEIRGEISDDAKILVFEATRFSWSLRLRYNEAWNYLAENPAKRDGLRVVQRAIGEIMEEIQKDVNDHGEDDPRGTIKKIKDHLGALDLILTPEVISELENEKEKVESEKRTRDMESKILDITYFFTHFAAGDLEPVIKDLLDAIDIKPADLKDPNNEKKLATEQDRIRRAILDVRVAPLTEIVDLNDQKAKAVEIKNQLGVAIKRAADIQVFKNAEPPEPVIPRAEGIKAIRGKEPEAVKELIVQLGKDDDTIIDTFHAADLMAHDRISSNPGELSRRPAREHAITVIEPVFVQLRSLTADPTAMPADALDQARNALSTLRPQLPALRAAVDQENEDLEKVDEKKVRDKVRNFFNGPDWVTLTADADKLLAVFAVAPGSIPDGGDRQKVVASQKKIHQFFTGQNTAEYALLSGPQKIQKVQDIKAQMSPLLALAEEVEDLYDKHTNPARKRPDISGIFGPAPDAVKHLVAGVEAGKSDTPLKENYNFVVTYLVGSTSDLGHPRRAAFRAVAKVILDEIDRIAGSADPDAKKVTDARAQLDALKALATDQAKEELAAEDMKDYLENDFDGGSLKDSMKPYFEALDYTAPAAAIPKEIAEVNHAKRLIQRFIVGLNMEALKKITDPVECHEKALEIEGSLTGVQKHLDTIKNLETTRNPGSDISKITAEAPDAVRRLVAEAADMTTNPDGLREAFNKGYAISKMTHVADPSLALTHSTVKASVADIEATVPATPPAPSTALTTVVSKMLILDGLLMAATVKEFEKDDAEGRLRAIHDTFQTFHLGHFKDDFKDLFDILLYDETSVFDLSERAVAKTCKDRVRKFLLDFEIKKYEDMMSNPKDQEDAEPEIRAQLNTLKNVLDRLDGIRTTDEADATARDTARKAREAEVKVDYDKIRSVQSEPMKKAITTLDTPGSTDYTLFMRCLRVVYTKIDPAYKDAADLSRIKTEANCRNLFDHFETMSEPNRVIHLRNWVADNAMMMVDMDKKLKEFEDLKLPMDDGPPPFIPPLTSPTTPSTPTLPPSPAPAPSSSARGGPHASAPVTPGLRNASTIQSGEIQTVMNAVLRESKFFNPDLDPSSAAIVTLIQDPGTPGNELDLADLQAKLSQPALSLSDAAQALLATPGVTSKALSNQLNAEKSNLETIQTELKDKKEDLDALMRGKATADLAERDRLRERINDLRKDEKDSKHRMHALEEAVNSFKSGSAKYASPRRVLEMILLYVNEKNSLNESAYDIYHAADERITNEVTGSTLSSKLKSLGSTLDDISEDAAFGSIVTESKTDKKAHKKAVSKKLGELEKAYNDPAKLEAWFESLPGGKEKHLKTTLPRLIAYLELAMQGSKDAHLTGKKARGLLQALRDMLFDIVHKNVDAELAGKAVGDRERTEAEFRELGKYSINVNKLTKKLITKEGRWSLDGNWKTVGKGALVAGSGAAGYGLSTVFGVPAMAAGLAYWASDKTLKETFESRDYARAAARAALMTAGFVFAGPVYGALGLVSPDAVRKYIESKKAQNITRKVGFGLLAGPLLASKTVRRLAFGGAPANDNAEPMMPPMPKPAPMPIPPKHEPELPAPEAKVLPFKPKAAKKPPEEKPGEDDAHALAA